MNNRKIKIPIIERIIIVGLDSSDIRPLLSKNINELHKEKSFIFGNIINSYSSVHLTEPTDKDFISKIPYYCYPKGIMDISPPGSKKRTFISFSLLSKNTRKHCTCLSINSPVQSYPSYVLSVNTGIVLISSKDLYVSHREILERLFDICNASNIGTSISSGGRSNSLSAVNSLVYSSQLSAINSNNNSRIEDYSSVDFFFAFVLNCLYYSKSNYGNLSNSLCVNVINNSSKQTNFLLFKIYIDDNGSESIISLKDYDISIVLERFYAEELIKIYLALLMEYRIVIVYDNNHTLTEVNLIINSLITLIFPLYSKHYLLVPYLNAINIKENVLNIPTCIILGIEQIHYDKIWRDLFTEKTIIFSLSKKRILFCPREFPSCPIKTQNEIASNLYQTLAEKLSINSELSFEDTDLGEMFEEKTCVKMNTILYFNMKVVSIFYQLFLKIISPFNGCFDFYKYENSNLSSVTRSNDLFDFTKFRNESTQDILFNKFIVEFSNSNMFNVFIKKYIKNYRTKAKYGFIHQMVEVMAPQKNFNQSLKRTFNICIKKKITEYYNFIYINYAKASDSYFTQLSKMKDMSIHYTNTSYSTNHYYCSITPIFKINSYLVRKYNEDYENYIIKNNDLMKKFDLWNIYNEIKSSGNSVSNNSFNNESNNSSNFRDYKKEHSIPIGVSKFDLGKKMDYLLPTSHFFNKEEIKVINEEEVRSIDSNSNDRELLTETKVTQMPLASKQPILISFTNQSKMIHNSIINNNSHSTGTTSKINVKSKKILSEKTKNKYETIGQQIKAKLNSNYSTNIVNSASNKNLTSLIKNTSLVSPKLSCHNRYELSLKSEFNSTRNAHSATKRDFINSKIKKSNINNNNLPKLEGDNDCDIFSEND